MSILPFLIWVLGIITLSIKAKMIISLAWAISPYYHYCWMFPCVNIGHILVYVMRIHTHRPMAYIDLFMFVLSFTPSPSPTTLPNLYNTNNTSEKLSKSPIGGSLSLSLSRTIVSMIALISMTFYFLFYYSSFVIPSLQKLKNITIFGLILFLLIF